MHDNDADPNDLPDADRTAVPYTSQNRHARRIAAAQQRKDVAATLQRAALVQRKAIEAERKERLAVERGAKSFNREVERWYKARQDEAERRVVSTTIFGR